MAACGGGDDEEAESTTTTAPAVQGADMVSIDMTDYAYSVSGPLTAGGMLRISNSGQELHMLGIGRLKPGVTIDQVRTALMEAGPPGGGGGGEGGGATTTTAADGDIRQQAGGTTTTAGGRGATTTTARGGTTTTGAGQEEEQDPTAELIDEVGFPGNIMSPGQSAEVTAPNLTPGKYAFVCFLPTEGEGTPHFAKGMINEMEVVEGPTPPEPNAEATYQITPGQPITGPATLTPGRHTLRIDAAPNSQQLEPMLTKLNPGTSFGQFVQRVEAIFEGEGEQPPAKGAAQNLPGEFVYAGFDLEGVTTFYLTTEFTAGTYTLVAADTDQEDATRQPREAINIRVA